jgi:hypothetical protein
MQLEDQIQCALVRWLKHAHPDVDFFHIPNGKPRTPIVGMILKQMGVSRGVSDLFFPGLKLFVELKSTEKARLTKEQVSFLEKRKKEGYHTLVTFGYTDAISKIKEFIESHKHDNCQ